MPQINPEAQTEMPKRKRGRPRMRDIEDNGCRTLVVKVPLAPAAEVPKTTFPLHVDLKIGPEYSWVLRRIAAALDKQQTTLSTGKRVVDASSALRWLLEQVRQ